MDLYPVVCPTLLQVGQAICQFPVDLCHSCGGRDRIRGVATVRKKIPRGEAMSIPTKKITRTITITTQPPAAIAAARECAAATTALAAAAAALAADRAVTAAVFAVRRAACSALWGALMAA